MEAERAILQAEEAERGKAAEETEEQLEMEATLELSTLFKDTRGEAESKNRNKKEEEATDAAAKQKQQQRENKMSDRDDDEETMRENNCSRVGGTPTKSNGPDTDVADHMDFIELETTPPRKVA